MNLQKKGYLYIILSAVCFATGGLLIKLNTWSAMTISGIRSVLAIPIFFVFFHRLGHKFKLNSVVVLGALANSGMYRLCNCKQANFRRQRHRFTIYHACLYHSAAMDILEKDARPHICLHSIALLCGNPVFLF